jgi:hypothetical protein
MIKEYKKYNSLLDIINSNIERSKNEFGLELRPEDEEKEKQVILKVFNEYKFKKLNEYTNDEYTKTFREVYKKIFDLLEDQARYYFYNTPEGGTKTRYNCHLECLIADLFRVALNEGVRWYD